MVNDALTTSNIDLFCDEVLTDPYPYYRELRDMGPAVYLEQTDAWALTRYAGIRPALKDWQTMTSTHGIAFNPVQNANTEGMIITTEGEVHDHQRAILGERLRLGAVRELTSELERQADEMVRRLVDRGSFDGVGDLARKFPSQVVGGLLGISKEASEKLFRWGDASFTVVGPLNDRTNAAFPVIAELLAFMGALTKDDFLEGSIGWSLWDAGERGEVPPETCPQMLWNFTGAGADTTISSMGNAVWLLGRDPEIWDQLRKEPSLIPSAVNEVLRYESSIQVWGRWTRADWDAEGTVIPAGSRVAMMLGSGNRDDRHYPDADHFDIHRNPRDHLAFGYGIHLCIGAPLARAQLSAVIGALVKHVERMDVGEPTRHFNNTVRGLETLPITVRAA
jgi:cytochrome P450